MATAMRLFAFRLFRSGVFQYFLVKKSFKHRVDICKMIAFCQLHMTLIEKEEVSRELFDDAFKENRFIPGERKNDLTMNF